MYGSSVPYGMLWFDRVKCKMYMIEGKIGMVTYGSKVRKGMLSYQGYDHCSSVGATVTVQTLYIVIVATVVCGGTTTLYCVTSVIKCVMLW